MIDEIQSWREHRADLTLEQIRGLEEIEMGLARLFIENPDRHARGRWMIGEVAAELAEHNHILSSKPPTDLSVPAGATAEDWKYASSVNGWWRTLSWLTYKSSSGIAIQVCGSQYEDGKCGPASLRVYDEDCSDPYAPDIKPDEARAMGEALIAAADLVESQRTSA